MSDESEYTKYAKDPRIACKYGTKCYQTNTIHHEKYKHPPGHQNKQSERHVNKKIKIDVGNEESNQVATSNDNSDFEDYNIEDDSDTASNKDDNLKEQTSISKSDDKDAESYKNISDKVSESIAEEPPKMVTSDNVKDSKNPVDKFSCQQFIKEKFLVDMPKDFYQFWDFCEKMKPANPLDALKDIGLKLVGPFDVLAGKFRNIIKSDAEYLLHWRYYHDPPEFQTVLKGDDKTGYHIGYFRDSPDEPPVFLASNSANKDGILHQMGANIFSAVNMYLENLKKSGDPFKKMHIGKIQASLKKQAKDLKLDLSPRPESIISREKKIVTRTFNKIGLVVPYNRKTQQGYRELALNNKDLSTLLTKLKNAAPEQKPKYLSDLQPVFTYASIAADECDFGTGIELGWNIISHGVDCLNSTVLRFLTTNYRLLNKETFAKIAEVHMSNRKKGCNLSII